MSINGIMNSSGTSTEDIYKKKSSAKASASAEKTTSAKESTTGVVYEPSDRKKTEKTTYKPNANLVAKLKADAEQRTSQFRQMVESMLTKQGQTFNKANDMWKILASGNFTVDRATAEAAQAEIGENGYWGVEQTSDRILSFAEALTGGDPDKMEKMRDAFIKGYKQATGAWGKELPDISSKTYDAVMKKFDDYGKTDKAEE